MAADVVKKIEITAALSRDYQAAFRAAGAIAKQTGGELQALTKRETDLQRLAALAAQKAGAAAAGDSARVQALAKEYDKLAGRLGMTGKTTAEIFAELKSVSGKKGPLQELQKTASTRAQLGKLALQIQRVGAAYEKLKDPALKKHLDGLKKQYADLGGETVKASGGLSKFIQRAAAAPGPVGAVAQSLLGLKNLLKGPAGAVALVAGLGAAAVAAGKALFSMGMDAAKSGDQIIKSADALGVTTDAYQELSYAMQRGGASEADFSSALKTLQSQMGAAASGNALARRSFEQFGVSLDDVRTMNAEEIFYRVADGIAAIDDPSQRMRASIKLLGGSGEKMAHAMSGGSAALAKLRDDAKKTGFVRTRAQLENAASATDALLDAQLSMKGALQEIGFAVLPAVIDILKSFSRFVAENREEIKAFASGAASFMKGAGVVIWKTLEAISVGIEVVKNGWQFWVDAVASGCQTVADSVGAVANFFTETIPGAIETVKTTVVGVFDSVVSYLKGLFDEILGFFLSLPKRIGSVLQDLPLLGDLFAPGAPSSSPGGLSPNIVINTNIDARGADSSAGASVRRALSASQGVAAGAVDVALNRYGALAGVGSF